MGHDTNSYAYARTIEPINGTELAELRDNPYSYKTEDLPMAIAKYRISLKGTDSKLVRVWI